jgi:hypothetical protein
MPRPTFDTDKKKKALAYKKLLLSLFLAAGLIYGGIFYFINKKVGTLVVQQPSTQAQAAITPAPYEPPQPAVKSNGWKPFFFHEKLIYCDSNYRVHVKTQIKEDDVLLANAFSDDLACIKLKQKSGAPKYVYVSTSGKTVIEPDYQFCGPFSEGLACFLDKNGEKLGFIDKTGKVAIQPQFYVSETEKHRDDELRNAIFSGGMAPVHNDRVVEGAESAPSCGYIDHKGRLLTPIKFLEGGAFVNDRARVWVRDQSQFHHRWGFINRKGDIVVKPIYMNVQDYSENLAPVLDYKGRWGYIDYSGKYKLPAEYTEATRFVDGVAAVAVVENDRSVWGYIKSDGTWLVKPQFERADSFADDEAYCCKNCSSKSTKEEFWINKDGTIEKHTRHLIPIALPDLSSSKEKSSQ